MGAEHKGPLAAFVVIAVIAAVLLVTSVRSQAAPGWLDPRKIPASVVAAPLVGLASGASGAGSTDDPAAEHDSGSARQLRPATSSTAAHQVTDHVVHPVVHQAVHQAVHHAVHGTPHSTAHRPKLHQPEHGRHLGPAQGAGDDHGRHLDWSRASGHDHSHGHH